jgi:tRNA(fMet)-specific endonuclease VapC
MTRFGDDLMKRLVLDTSAYSHMRTGHAELLDLLAAAESLLVPVTVLGELEGAFELGSRAKANRQALTEFLSEPFVFVLDTTPEVARHYGQIYGRQRRSGRPVPVNDMWIAASAIDNGGHLLTFDSDFRRIEGLDCTILAS